MAAGITSLIDSGYSLVNDILIPLAFSICLLYFFWGVAKYIKGGASEKDAKEGRSIMTWGLVGIFVAFSIWGIISFIRNELGVPNVTNVSRP